MKTCKTCKYWEQNTSWDYEGAVNDGFCRELLGEIICDVEAGWDGGYVKTVETTGDFGCILHKPK